MRPSSGLLLAALVGCGSKGDSAPGIPEPDLVEVLAEPGPYGAGYREIELTWTDATLGDRTLRVAVWYPSTDTEGPDFKYMDAFEARDVVLDGAVADGTFPVAVFSHGHLAYAEAASFLSVHLASHGWVVVAPEHLDNTFLDGDNRNTAIYWQRPLDLSATLDHLEALPAGDPLAGHLDDGPYLAFGHSFGGYSGFAVAGATYDLDAIDAGCTSEPGDAICTDWPAMRDRFTSGFGDPRFGALLSMAAGDHKRFGDAGVAAVGVPVLTMTGGLDPGANNDEYWDALTGAAHRRVHVSSGTHNSFSDFSGALDVQPGMIDPEEGWRTIRSYALAWAWRMRGDERGAPVLDGEREVHPDAELRAH